MRRCSSKTRCPSTPPLPSGVSGERRRRRGCGWPRRSCRRWLPARSRARRPAPRDPSQLQSAPDSQDAHEGPSRRPRGVDQRHHAHDEQEGPRSADGERVEQRGQEQRGAERRVDHPVLSGHAIHAECVVGGDPAAHRQGRQAGAHEPLTAPVHQPRHRGRTSEHDQRLVQRPPGQRGQGTTESSDGEDRCGGHLALPVGVTDRSTRAVEIHEFATFSCHASLTTWRDGYSRSIPTIPRAPVSWSAAGGNTRPVRSAPGRCHRSWLARGPSGPVEGESRG